MSYQVLARKWRPQKFAELVGQEHVVSAISNALDNNKLHHAYLFTGTRGVGKTTIARIFSKSLNCETGQSATPCGTCDACRDIDEGRFVDLLEIDAASRTKVEDTRELLDNVQYKPTRGRFKVYLIDEVHMLSKHSFNALLKTLEEPPPHVKFLLATTDPQKLPVTILSRCLQFSLKALSREQIQTQLDYILTQEGIPSEPAALSHLARAAQGSMRDALSLTDQAIAQGNNNVSTQVVIDMLGLLDKNQVLRLVKAVIEDDKEEALNQLDEICVHAPDYSQVLSELLSLLHQVSLTQIVPDICKIETLSARAVYQLSKSVTAEHIQLLYQLVLQGKKDLPYAPDPFTGLQMTVLRMLAFSPAQKIELDLQSAHGQALAEKKTAELVSHASEKADTIAEQVEEKLDSAVSADSFTIEHDTSPQINNAEQAPAENEDEHPSHLTTTSDLLALHELLESETVDDELEVKNKSEGGASSLFDRLMEQDNSIFVTNDGLPSKSPTKAALEAESKVFRNPLAEHETPPWNERDETDDDDNEGLAADSISATNVSTNSDDTKVKIEASDEIAAMFGHAFNDLSNVTLTHPNVSPYLENGDKLLSAAQINKWSDFIEELDVGGLNKQLLLQANLVQHGDHFIIRLHEQNKHLDEAQHRTTIMQALSKFYGKAVKFEVQYGDVDETPFKIQQQISLVRQQHAQDIVQKNDSIQELIKAFDGRVIEGSIKPR